MFYRRYKIKIIMNHNFHILSKMSRQEHPILPHPLSTLDMLRFTGKWDRFLRSWCITVSVWGLSSFLLPNVGGDCALATASSGLSAVAMAIGRTAGHQADRCRENWDLPGVLQCTGLLPGQGLRKALARDPQWAVRPSSQVRCRNQIHFSHQGGQFADWKQLRSGMQRCQMCERCLGAQS